MQFIKYPSWADMIIYHYWPLRNARSFDTARIRKQYRLIEKEKKRLHEAGVDGELVRLLCRHMVNPRNPLAAQRFHIALLKSQQTSFEFVV